TKPEPEPSIEATVSPVQNSWSTKSVTLDCAKVACGLSAVSFAGPSGARGGGAFVVPPQATRSAASDDARRSPESPTVEQRSNVHALGPHCPHPPPRARRIASRRSASHENAQRFHRGAGSRSATRWLSGHEGNLHHGGTEARRSDSLRLR